MKILFSLSLDDVGGFQSTWRVNSPPTPQPRSRIISMGVSKLLTFISDHPSLFETKTLTNGILMIDGFALSHFFFEELIERVTLSLLCIGTDLNAFREIAESFFELLEKSGVIPVVVVDLSGISQSDSSGEQTKTAEWATRKVDRIRRKNRCFSYFKKAQLQLNIDVPEEKARLKHDVEPSPLCMTELLAIILNERNIECIVASGEADQTLVVEARKRNAIGILSNDTDFAIFSGVSFIPSSLLRMTRTSLRGLHVTAANLCAHFNISHAALTEVAALSGNDFTKSMGLLWGLYPKLRGLRRGKNTFECCCQLLSKQIGRAHV